MTRPLPENPCYRTRNGIEHNPHEWTNGIEVQYPVQCPGYTRGTLMVAPLLTRPNGKPYRPRSEIRVEHFTNQDDCTAIVVIGTHDVDRARELALPWWENEYDRADFPEGVRRWWRLVPWGYDGGTWLEDEVRGRPVVTFEPDPW
jgi:hypothetical protein